MAKKKPAKDVKVKEADGAVEGDVVDKKEDGDTADHPDASKDVELIKKIIAQHLGDKVKGASPEDMEALEGLAKEAYEAHKEMGKEDGDAEKAAGQAVELAHHMHSKKKEKKDGAADGGGADSGGAAEADVEAKEDDAAKEPVEEKECDKESDDKKESNREKELEKKLLEAEGRLAALEAKDKKAELQRHVDAKLKESGQPSSITKRFREAAGDFKSKEDFDSKWKIFSAGVKDAPRTLDFGLLMEKAMPTEEGVRAKSESGFDFSMCAE